LSVDQILQPHIPEECDLQKWGCSPSPGVYIYEHNKFWL